MGPMSGDARIPAAPAAAEPVQAIADQVPFPQDVEHPAPAALQGTGLLCLGDCSGTILRLATGHNWTVVEPVARRSNTARPARVCPAAIIRDCCDTSLESGYYRSSSSYIYIPIYYYY